MGPDVWAKAYHNVRELEGSLGRSRFALLQQFVTTLCYNTLLLRASLLHCSVVRNPLIAEVIAEAFGTFVLVSIRHRCSRDGGPVRARDAGEVVNGGFTNITIAWGLAVTMAVYLTAKISGAHLNPAVTLALAAFRGFSWNKVLPYCVAQMLGGFCGAALTYLNYRPAFLKVDPDLSRTAGVFTTFPAFPGVPMAGFLDQVIGTALWFCSIFALSDENNIAPPPHIAPLLVGLVVVRDRNVFRRHAWVRHQSGARLRPAAAYRARRLSEQRFDRWIESVSGAARSAPDRRTGRRSALRNSDRPVSPAERECKLCLDRRHVIAATTAASYGRILGANDRVGVGFVGYGLIGAQHVFDFKNQKDVDMVAMSDTYQPRMEQGIAACGGNAKAIPTSASCSTTRTCRPSSSPRPIIGTA